MFTLMVRTSSKLKSRSESQGNHEIFYSSSCLPCTLTLNRCRAYFGIIMKPALSAVKQINLPPILWHTLLTAALLIKGVPLDERKSSRFRVDL